VTYLRSAVLLLVVAIAAPAAAAEARDPFRDVVELGTPTAATVSWRDLVVEVPVRVRPVGVAGTIHGLRFEELRLNGIPFEVDPYETSFELPEKEPVTLAEPLRLRLNFRRVAPGLIEEAFLPSDTLRLTGRVAVAGTFRKWIFSSKRTVEVPLDVTSENPLAGSHPLKLALAELKRWEQQGWKLPF
jgi:hypothetical protein